MFPPEHFREGFFSKRDDGWLAKHVVGLDKKVKIGKPNQTANQKKKKMDAEKKFHALGAVDIIVIVVFVLASVFVGLWAGNNVKRKKRAGSGGWRRIESGDDDEEDSHDDRDDPENVVAVRHANGRHVSSMHSKTISSNENNGEASDEYFTAGRRQHCCIVSMGIWLDYLPCM